MSMRLLRSLSAQLPFSFTHPFMLCFSHVINFEQSLYASLCYHSPPRSLSQFFIMRFCARVKFCSVVAQAVLISTAGAIAPPSDRPSLRPASASRYIDAGSVGSRKHILLRQGERKIVASSNYDVEKAKAKYSYGLRRTKLEESSPNHRTLNADDSEQPSSEPSLSSEPSSKPSSQPSEDPSSQPSGEPSSEPSSTPSCQPSASPTQAPSQATGLNLFYPEWIPNNDGCR